MIICNKCGNKNEDASRSCQVCGHKLQSDRKTGPVRESAPRLVAPFGSERESGAFPLLFKHLEAWAWAMALLGCAVYGLFSGDFTPLWIGLPVVAAIAWLRRL